MRRVSCRNQNENINFLNLVYDVMFILFASLAIQPFECEIISQ